MLEVFQYGFMRNALAASILVSIACGIIGTYVVINRIVFLSGGIAHAAYGGIGFGYLLRISLGSLIDIVDKLFYKEQIFPVKMDDTRGTRLEVIDLRTFQRGHRRAFE